MTQERIVKLSRKTKETDIKIELNIDGTGKSNIDTGLKFLTTCWNHLVNMDFLI